MLHHPLPRIDKDEKLSKMLLPFCRLKQGEIWEDPTGKHKVGCLDAGEKSQVNLLFGKKHADAAIHDPPYNFVAFKERELNRFISLCKKWIIHFKF